MIDVMQIAEKAKPLLPTDMQSAIEIYSSYQTAREVFAVIFPQFKKVLKYSLNKLTPKHIEDTVEKQVNTRETSNAIQTAEVQAVGNTIKIEEVAEKRVNENVDIQVKKVVPRSFFASLKSNKQVMAIGATTNFLWTNRMAIASGDRIWVTATMLLLVGAHHKEVEDLEALNTKKKHKTIRHYIKQQLLLKTLLHTATAFVASVRLLLQLTIKGIIIPTVKLLGKLSKRVFKYLSSFIQKILPPKVNAWLGKIFEKLLKKAKRFIPKSLIKKFPMKTGKLSKIGKLGKIFKWVPKVFKVFRFGWMIFNYGVVNTVIIETVVAPVLAHLPAMLLLLLKVGLVVGTAALVYSHFKNKYAENPVNESAFDDDEVVDTILHRKKKEKKKPTNKKESVLQAQEQIEGFSTDSAYVEPEIKITKTKTSPAKNQVIAEDDPFAESIIQQAKERLETKEEKAEKIQQEEQITKEKAEKVKEEDLKDTEIKDKPSLPVPYAMEKWSAYVPEVNEFAIPYGRIAPAKVCGGTMPNVVRDALAKASKITGVPFETLAKVAKVESGYNPEAVAIKSFRHKNKNTGKNEGFAHMGIIQGKSFWDKVTGQRLNLGSSLQAMPYPHDSGIFYATYSTAAGLFQNLKSTWKDRVRLFGKQKGSDYVVSSESSPFNPLDAAVIQGRFINSTQRYCTSGSADDKAAVSYIVHNLGTGDGNKFLSSLYSPVNKNKKVTEIGLGKGSIDNNPGFFYADPRRKQGVLTVAQAYEKYKKHFSSRAVNVASILSSGNYMVDPNGVIIGVG